MRICFIDFAPWDYDVSTPFERPLGGSQSAMCYLAIELAEAGHEVTVVTNTTKPDCEYEGVKCSFALPSQSSIDIMVALNAPTHGSKLRSALSSSTRLVLWTQHAGNQPVMRRMAEAEHRDIWDDIVCVSDWQRNDLIERYDINPDRVKVIRNAIGPSFENLFASHQDLVAAKSCDRLRLAYTSTPYRGLKLLPDIFKIYHAANPDAVLEVYSSMAVYMENDDEDHRRFGAIYDAVSSTDGAKLIGSVSQPVLSDRLRSAHILAYPNAFPETSCIAVMEALAAGMRVVSTELGALPETCEGFAHLVPIEIEIDDDAASIAVNNVSEYSSKFLSAMKQATYTTAGLYEQVEHMNRHHTWSVRAREWERFLG